MTPSLNEADVLKPKSPTIEDDNEWEEFTLKNVEVFDQEGRLMSLLHADESNSLTVVGKIGQLPVHQRPLLLDRTVRNISISVTDVQRFAYGLYDDGEVALWAAGRSGWYEIRPSRTYKNIYKSMEEAVKVLYFTTDFYRDNKSKKARKVSVEAIFSSYAEQPGSNCMDSDEAAEVFRRHQKFLLDSMNKDKSVWTSTPIYDHLLKETPITPPERSDLDDDDSDITEDTVRRLAGKGKSVLRPKSNRFSKKSAGRRTSSPTERASAVIDDKNLKRKFPSSTEKKKPRKRMQVVESVGPDSTVLSSNDADSSSADDTLLPLGLRPANPESRSSDLILDIVEEPLPSYEPQGPGDTWTCTLDGCSHVVYGASSLLAKVLIKEHYRSHALESQTQLDLVQKEERPYLPVSNLIKRIREMASQHIPLATSAKDPLPKPIERKS